jgi:uncharacterized membrane protein YkoI
MTHTNRSITLLGAFLLVSSTAAAQKTAAKHETEAQLKAEAKIPEATARATALAKVPGGKVKKYELERENGKLLYSYDIATPGKSGIDEVQVDAITGATVGDVVHESAATERKEAAKEAKEAKSAKQASKAKTP